MTLTLWVDSDNISDLARALRNTVTEVENGFLRGSVGDDICRADFEAVGLTNQ